MMLEVSIMKGSVPCTLRLEEEIYTRVKELARARHTSVSELVQGVLTDMLKKEEQKNLYDAFSLAGEDHESADVGYAVPAQREVAERHE
jgi:predicted DNA-binding ribbon-helix-helix protein